MSSRPSGLLCMKKSIASIVDLLIIRKTADCRTRFPRLMSVQEVEPPGVIRPSYRIVGMSVSRRQSFETP